MSITLYGKPVAEAIKQDVLKRADSLRKEGITPSLAIVRAGNRIDDTAYEKRVLKLCTETHIEARVYETAADIPHTDFEQLIISLNKADDIHGILIFRPLPSQIDEKKISTIISSKKDADCMNSENLKKVFLGDNSAAAPCTPEAVIELLKYYDYELEGKNVVIVNRSLVVGKPLSMLFLDENSTVTICHSKTKNLNQIMKSADIVVSGVGRPKHFGKESVAEHSVLVDVGINFADGKMCGDFDFQAVEGTVQAVTPVPGGIGTITSAILLRNLIRAAESR